MKRLAALCLFLVAPAAFAAIEKFATPSDSGVTFQWWPKVSPPRGWHHDEGSSRYFGFNAIAPDRSTFSKADTVLYAKAAYKPRAPQIKSLAAFVASDVAALRSSEPGISVTRSPSCTAATASFSGWCASSRAKGAPQPGSA